MKIKLLLMSTIILSMGLTACGNGNKQPNNAQTTPAQADPHKVYQNFCISCHGNQLQGGEGPNIQKVGERLTEDEIIKRIQKGGGGMPPFQVALKEEELKVLAAWLAGLK
ncbi:MULTISPECIES: cytochrome c [Paenibacillus]|uniref:Cytochrome c n=1 Tax=Paenibacillus violae TaxID=3077234 RepID=A0ABU3RF70_9BACL|nr:MULTISPECIES: cytochrome c [Paenibacillus]MDU0202886.1 cytochrome c [Paenibacillus sp. PFR10]MEC0266044.1 cytochrome c [Paenibacillus anseongense]